MTSPNCPVCGSKKGRVIYTALHVPTHSVRLINDAESALTVDKGNIRLCACEACGFVWNLDFQPELMHYDQDYEETQGFSDTFNLFQKEMASQLVDRFELKGKSVLEIGCGKGELLTQLLELGISQGFGYDPSFKADRLVHDSRLSFVTDFFPPKTTQPVPNADVYWCKMTLEHIPLPGDFIQQLASHISDGQVGNKQALLIFQVPALERILEEVAYWDIYYEHCNYFSRNSLYTLFAKRGFEVLEISSQFNDQYHTIVVKPNSATPNNSTSASPELITQINRFETEVKATLSRWETTLSQAALARSSNNSINTGDSENGGLLIWGAASKAVGLLNALPTLRDGIRLVDINPYKHGTYLPSTNLKIEAPDTIKKQHFECILVANPVYREEVEAMLKSLNVSGKLICLGSECP